MAMSQDEKTILFVHRVSLSLRALPPPSARNGPRIRRYSIRRLGGGHLLEDLFIRLRTMVRVTMLSGSS